jgi:hypothetical protein
MDVSGFMSGRSFLDGYMEFILVWYRLSWLNEVNPAHRCRGKTAEIAFIRIRVGSTILLHTSSKIAAGDAQL